jgi:hypothetical protein
VQRSGGRRRSCQGEAVGFLRTAAQGDGGDGRAPWCWVEYPLPWMAESERAGRLQARGDGGDGRAPWCWVESPLPWMAESERAGRLQVPAAGDWMLHRRRGGTGTERRPQAIIVAVVEAHRRWS